MKIDFQKRILSTSAIVLVLLPLFYFLIFIPQRRRLISLKKELIKTELQISRISGVTEDSDLPGAAKKLKLELEKIRAAIPYDGKAIINLLTTEAKKPKIELKNIAPGKNRLSADKVTGYEIYELPLSINISSDFKALGEFLIYLKEQSPILIKLQHIEIKGQGEGAEVLDTVLSLTAYLARGKA